MTFTQQRKNRKTATNTGFASGGVTCKLGALCFYSSSVLVDSLVLRNPPERKAQNVSGKQMTNRKQMTMNKNKGIKLTFLFTIILGFISCIQETKSNNQTETSNNVDTIIVKHKNELNKSYEVGFYSKSYSYYWVAGKDTLDFVVNATEYESDSTLNISVNHKKPILYTITLTKINECLPLIKNDFHLFKLNSLYFKEPIFYFDLAKELATEYELQFGRKNINYEKLNQFLLNSKMNIQLNDLIKPLDKTVKRYSIEKFHLMDKKYFSGSIPNVDLTEYPEFTINGMGLSVQLENKQN